MFCPECGRNVPDGASFCPSCGRYLNFNNPQADPQYVSPEPSITYYAAPAPQRGFLVRNSSKILVVAVVALVIFAVFVMPLFTDHGRLYGKSFATETDASVSNDAVDSRAVVLIDGSDYGTVSFTDNSTAHTSMEHVIAIELNGSISEGYDVFTWSYAHPVGDTTSQIDSDAGTAYLYTDGFGEYSLNVVCNNTSTSAHNDYTFNIRIDDLGDFEWTYEGGSFHLLMHFKHEDYEAYSPAKGTSDFDARDVTDWSKTPDFVKDADGSVATIEKCLRSLYTDAFGACTEDQDYADFILCYVQECFTYMTDSELYHTDNDYFAYPIETIYHKGGDCEDTSILCSSIYKAAGFETAVLIVPQHAMTAVSLDSYTADTSSGYIMSGKVGGTTYYAGETTAGSYQPVGISYSYEDGHPYTYYLNRGIVGQGSYTFYEVS